MAKLKVQGFESLVRDTKSNAIVNTNVTEYQLYMKRLEARKTNSDQIKDACREINSLKQEMYEIKQMILELGKKNGS
jgi:hypothetical protein